MPHAIEGHIAQLGNVRVVGYVELKVGSWEAEAPVRHKSECHVGHVREDGACAGRASHG